LINAKKSGQIEHEVSQLNETELPVLSSTPVSNWSEMDQHQHFAQFYETDLFLMNALAGFVSSGLSSGDGVMVVATESHRVQLEKLLVERGVDVTGANAASQYLILDAAQTLAEFMINGSPEPQLFTKTIRPVIELARKGRSSVRIFGEMVALLWQQRNFEGAIRLEELWNNLHRSDPFLLFCAYPINGFDGAGFSTPLSSVCAEHSCVIPAESYTELTSSDSRLCAILDLQQKARALQAEIAERKQAEEALRGVKEELQRQLEISEELLSREQIARADAENANRMKDEFLATVSHELRTPLNAIIGWSHMLRSGRLDQPTFARALETIDRNAKAQAQLIEDILDVSRVITGKLRLNMASVDVAAIINAAIDSVQLAAESKGIKLAVTLDPSARHTLGDESRLQQVVWNLLSNAIKFTPPGGLVQIKLSRTDDSIQIRVGDSGQGIRAEFLPFIFDRFRQADGTTTRQHGGLGLGLSIVRHLVELHGGTVHVDSPGEGLGAAFTIKLPLSPRPKALQVQERGPESLSGIKETGEFARLPSLEDVRVLLVDNDRDTLQVLTVMLRERRANVQAAITAVEALEALQWFKPDVLVSDLALPDEDGYSLIRRIRNVEGKINKPIPAVALTAYVRVEDRARALSAGFSMFVPKPVEPNELLIAIANLVESER
jgi:signal transduction histidine kinase/ActR/RegA family two-component response regulator